MDDFCPIDGSPVGGSQGGALRIPFGERGIFLLLCSSCYKGIKRVEHHWEHTLLDRCLERRLKAPVCIAAYSRIRRVGSFIHSMAQAVEAML